MLADQSALLQRFQGPKSTAVQYFGFAGLAGRPAF